MTSTAAGKQLGFSGFTGRFEAEVTEIFSLFCTSNNRIPVSDLAVAINTLTGKEIGTTEINALIARVRARKPSIINMGQVDVKNIDFNARSSSLAAGVVGVDINEFRTIVETLITPGSLHDECELAFKLLEDRSIRGFITKERVTAMAKSCGEQLTDEDINAMFDPRVLGAAAGAAVDFDVFMHIQYEAERRKLSNPDE